MTWLYTLSTCIRISNSFLFLANFFMTSMYIRWLTFSCDLLSLYPPVHLPSMWLTGIIAITNSNGDSASPWNISLWIFAWAKLFPRFYHPGFHGFLDKVYDLYIWGSLLSCFAGLCHMPYWSQFTSQQDFFVLTYSRWGLSLFLLGPMHLCYRKKGELSRAFPERIGICRNTLLIKFKTK